MPHDKPLLHYNAASFSAGRMDFAWEELTEVERAQAYADWDAGKGLIGGDPRRRPGSDRLPAWGVDRPFFRTLAMDDPSADNGCRLRSLITGGRPLEVEIGFGRGDFLLDRARRCPDTIFVAYETKTKATRLLLDRIERFQLANLWVSDDDCRFSMPRMLPDRRIEVVHILFPDPWWKEQHRVKRLFSPPFVDLLAVKMQSGGLLHFKSDVREYGELVSYLVSMHVAFGPNDPALAETLVAGAPTHREHWCKEHGRSVYAYYFKRL